MYYTYGSCKVKWTKKLQKQNKDTIRLQMKFYAKIQFGFKVAMPGCWFVLGWLKSLGFWYKTLRFCILINVFKTGPVIESEKLPVHGSLVGPAVEPVTS